MQLFAGLEVGRGLLSHDFASASQGTFRRYLPVSGRRVPQHGGLLFQGFLNNPDLQPGLRYQLRQFLATIRTSHIPHDKKLFRKVWKEFIALEQEAYEKVSERTPFQVSTSDGLQDIGPCRYFCYFYQVKLINHSGRLGNRKIFCTLFLITLPSNLGPFLMLNPRLWIQGIVQAIYLI